NQSPPTDNPSVFKPSDKTSPTFGTVRPIPTKPYLAVLVLPVTGELVGGDLYKVIGYPTGNLQRLNDVPAVKSIVLPEIIVALVPLNGNMASVHIFYFSFCRLSIKDHLVTHRTVKGSFRSLATSSRLILNRFQKSITD